jgi:hypothetical protein
LNGHDHDLQELNPPGGPRILVSGAGGNGLYALHSEPYLAWGRDSVYGALRLQLRAGGASYAFVAFDGRVLRRGSVRCRG